MTVSNSTRKIKPKRRVKLLKKDLERKTKEKDHSGGGEPLSDDNGNE